MSDQSPCWNPLLWLTVLALVVIALLAGGCAAKKPVVTKLPPLPPSPPVTMRRDAAPALAVILPKQLWLVWTQSPNGTKAASWNVYTSNVPQLSAMRLWKAVTTNRCAITTEAPQCFYGVRAVSAEGFESGWATTL